MYKVIVIHDHTWTFQKSLILYLAPNLGHLDIVGPILKYFNYMIKNTRWIYVVRRENFVCKEILYVIFPSAVLK